MPQQPPKFFKNGAQKHSNRGFPQNGTHGQSGGIGQADIPLANPKAQLQPGPKSADGEQKVRNMGMPGAQGSQKAVVQTQDRSQQAGDGKSLQRNSR